MGSYDDDPEEAEPGLDDEVTCWCGASGPYRELFDQAVFQDTCGGLCVLYCLCGGDHCVCHHHGQVDCPGCEDCQREDDWDDHDYDD